MPRDQVNGSCRDDQVSASAPALLREVNERIRELSGRFGGDEPAPFVCECEDGECLSQVTLTVGEYDAAREACPEAPILAHGARLSPRRQAASHD
jgi:hypothetical protein